jgi:hypothetical protein
MALLIFLRMAPSVEKNHSGGLSFCLVLTSGE